MLHVSDAAALSSNAARVSAQRNTELAVAASLSLRQQHTAAHAAQWRTLQAPDRRAQRLCRYNRSSYVRAWLPRMAGLCTRSLPSFLARSVSSTRVSARARLLLRLSRCSRAWPAAWRSCTAHRSCSLLAPSHPARARALHAWRAVRVAPRSRCAGSGYQPAAFSPRSHRHSWPQRRTRLLRSSRRLSGWALILLQRSTT